DLFLGGKAILSRIRRGQKRLFFSLRACCMSLIAVCLAIACAPQTVEAAGVPLPVPRVTLYPGDAIQPDHLAERIFNSRISASGAVYRGRDDLIGKVARRTLLPGEPIP